MRVSRVSQIAFVAVLLPFGLGGLGCPRMPSSTTVTDIGKQDRVMAMKGLGSWIVVNGLEFDTEDEDLLAALAGFGHVRQARVIIHHDGYNEGFGFAEFTDAAAADRAILALDGATPFNIHHVVRVNPAKSRKYQEIGSIPSLTRADGTRVEVGDPVVLESGGLIGRIGLIDRDEDGLFLAFDVYGGRSRVSASPESDWRPLMSWTQADSAEREIIAATPIPGVTLTDGKVAGWKSEAALKLVDLYLDGDRAHRIVAIATLLDWADEAMAAPGDAKLSRGALRGRLARARDSLLGELEWVRGESRLSVQDRLIRARRGAVRDAPVAPPAAPEPPLIGLGGSDGGDALAVGVHALGDIEVSGALTVVDNGWENPIFPIDDAVRIQAQPGRWRAWLFVQEEEPTASLRDEFQARNPPDKARELVEQFKSIFRRKWLVMGATTEAPSPPTPATSSTPGYDEIIRAIAAVEDFHEDPLKRLEMSIINANGRRDLLQMEGIVGEWSGRLAVVTRRGFTPEWALALRYAPSAAANAWPWGLVWWRTRAGTPVFVGGPPDARTWIAVPDPGF